MLSQSILSIAKDGNRFLGSVFGGRRWIERDIANHYSYLKFEKGAIAHYLQEYEEKEMPIGLINRNKRRFYKHFLISTDFFLHQEDGGRIIQFVGYYDPYDMPCYSPLGVLS
jgi:hypothetical protein